MISYDKSDADLTAFWTDMAHKLFWNVGVLYEQIETHYADKSPEEGPGAQMAVGRSLGNRLMLHADHVSAGILCLHMRFLGLLSLQVSKQ